MRILVTDLDNTLIRTPRTSRFFFLLSWVFQVIGRRLQGVNTNLLKHFEDYDKVVILSGRSLTDFEPTKRQLKRLRIPYDDVMCCPVTTIVGLWKLRSVRDLMHANHSEVWWIDDELGRSIQLGEPESYEFSLFPLKVDS